MLDCLIIGDSIAVGIAEVRQDCDSIAVVGISSNDFNQRYGHDNRMVGGYSTVIISLGSNDWDPRITKDNLIEIRDRIGAERVLWMLPGIKLSKQRAVVAEVAKIMGDGVISTSQVSPDGVHPTGRGYKSVGQMF